MGRRIAVLLTVTAMLWHAVVGCCAHHVHAEEACCGAAQAQHQVAPHDHQHDGCGHSHAVAEVPELVTHSEMPVDSEHQSHCGELRCFFVTSDSVDLPTADMIWAQLNWLMADHLAVLAGECDLPGVDALALPTSRGAAMRRHLALSVLLI